MALENVAEGIYIGVSTDNLESLVEGDKVFFKDTEDYCYMNEDGELAHIEKTPYKTKSRETVFLIPQEILQYL